LFLILSEAGDNGIKVGLLVGTAEIKLLQISDSDLGAG